MGQEKNHLNKKEDTVLQVEQWMLIAKHVAAIDLSAVICSKRRDGKKPK